MKNSITYVAMDTHKKEHKVALHYPDDEQIIQFVVKNTVSDIRKMVKKIKSKTQANVEFCYEAGVWSSRHNIVPSFRFNLFSLFLLPFGIKSATLFNRMRNFNAPHRTGRVDFLHPALQ